MKKIMFFGSLLTVFLLVLLPNVNSIEYSQTENVEKKVSVDISSKYFPLNYKTLIKLKQNFQRPLCDYLYNLVNFTVIFAWLLHWPIIIVRFLVSIAFIIGCDWAWEPLRNLSLVTLNKIDVPCSSCDI